MPRKKATQNSKGAAKAQAGRRGGTGISPATRVSHRSSTIKKIAQSKEKRNSRKASSKDRRNPWEESDDDGNYQQMYVESNSEIDSEPEEGPNGRVKLEIPSDDSEFEFKDDNPMIYIEDLSEKIFCPWVEIEPTLIPPLILPCSSSDLLVDKDHLFDTLEIYEILRSYCHTIQISPFLFEDFCSALRSPVQSKLLCEIHIALIKLLFRDDEDDQTLYSVQDTNSSFNILMALIEPMTFAEILRQYVQSDPSFSPEILHILTTTNYPFVELEKRLAVLKFLCERFLESIVFKRLINREMKIVHDEHCRDCGRQGDVLLCDGCEACYHLSCTRLEEVPRGKWLCQICEAHEVSGVANCLMPGERDYRFSRRTEPLGYDRHKRIYWFVARRLFVQDVENNELHYYSSLPQIYELMAVLDDRRMEERLCKALVELLPTIADHMRITLELTDERRKNLQEKIQRESPSPYLQVDNVHRMSKIVANLVLDGSDENSSQASSYNDVVKSECGAAVVKSEEGADVFVSALRKHIQKTLKTLLGIENGHLAGTLWSGGYDESQLLDYHHRLENEAALASSSMSVNGANALEDFQLTLLENLQRGYRLGFSDAEYRNYVNHYSVSDFAKSPYTRAKERDRRKYMCSKFSLADEGEFSWIVAKNRDCFASEQDVGRWIQFTLRRLLERLSDELMHRLWPYDEKPRFQEYLQGSVTVETLKHALLQFECAVRKPIFCTVWWNTLGHTRLVRLTSEERDRRQKIDTLRKKDEKTLVSADASDEDFVWVKYSLYKNGPPRHNIWRLKDEQFRVNGREKLGGWMWISSTILRTFVDLPQRPRLGISYRTPRDEIKTPEEMQAFSFDKLIKFLTTRRILNEAVMAARSASPACYSPSCRLVAKGTRAFLATLSATGSGDYRPCYSPSCPRRFLHPYENFTADIVKAYKSFRPNPYIRSKEPRKPEETPGMGKAFPFPRPFEFRAKKSGKRSILVLPQKALRRLARQGGLNATTYIPGYHKQSKNNYHVWNYPCQRPLFDNTWRYLTINANSLHALALQLRIIYACIRWADLEPVEKDEEDPRVWSHQPDFDEVRTVINHKEYPPDGYYEQYKIRIERYSLHDDSKDAGAAFPDDDTSADYTTTAVKTLRKKRRKNQKVTKEIYVKRRRTSVEERWIDGVELKLYEIRDYWARYFYERRQKYEEFKQKQRQQQQFKTQQQQRFGSGGVFHGGGSMALHLDSGGPRQYSGGHQQSSSRAVLVPRVAANGAQTLHQNEDRQLINSFQRTGHYYDGAPRQTSYGGGPQQSSSRVVLVPRVAGNGAQTLHQNEGQRFGTGMIPHTSVDASGNKYIVLPNGHLSRVPPGGRVQTRMIPAPPSARATGGGGKPPVRNFSSQNQYHNMRPVVHQQQQQFAFVEAKDREINEARRLWQQIHRPTQ